MCFSLVFFSYAAPVAAVALAGHTEKSPECRKTANPGLSAFKIGGPSRIRTCDQTIMSRQL